MEFSDFREFSGVVLPGSIRVIDDHNLIVDAQLEKLEAFSPPDDSVFVPSPNARRETICKRNLTPPKAIQTPDPDYPSAGTRQRIEGRVTVAVEVA
jgi:hypothetical protein